MSHDDANLFYTPLFSQLDRNNNNSHLNRLSQSIRSNNNNNNTSSSQSSSSLIHKLSNLSLQQPQLTSTDQQINSSDSNSTSTTTSQHHEPTHPITSSDTNSDHNNNNNLFSEQEPTQSQPSQDTLNDITTLALSARITEIAMSIQEVALALFQVQVRTSLSTTPLALTYISPSH